MTPSPRLLHRCDRCRRFDHLASTTDLDGHVRYGDGRLRCPYADCDGSMRDATEAERAAYLARITADGYAPAWPVNPTTTS